MRSYMTSLETISTNLPIPLYHHARTVGGAAHDTPGDVVETPSAAPTNLFSQLGKAPRSYTQITTMSLQNQGFPTREHVDNFHQSE